MKVAIYGGSFNPIHNGHIGLAEYIVEHTDCDELWFMVTPQNPLKPKEGMASDEMRLEMARLAVEERENIKVSDIEMRMPKPNYTIDTLMRLRSEYVGYEFCLVIGEDNMDIFDKWKSYDEILNQFEVMVYPREGSVRGKSRFEQMKLLSGAPLLKYSSTEVRERIAARQSIRDMVPEKVAEYIEKTGPYK